MFYLVVYVSEEIQILNKLKHNFIILECATTFDKLYKRYRDLERKGYKSMIKYQR